MEDFNIAEAKTRFSELVERAEAGETLRIMRRGKLVAQLVPAEQRKKRIDIKSLRKLTESSPRQPASAGEFMRKIRDEERY